MPLTLAQLTAPLTAGQLTTLLLNALQGLGAVVQSNGSNGAPAGSGSATLSGTPAAAYSIVVKVSTSGELGAAQYQLSTDGGTTYGAATTFPSTGIVILGSTGATATFAAGPSGAGTSFVAGDLFSFSLSVPTLPTTSWQAGSVPRTLVAVDANVLSDFSALIAAIAAGGLLNYATGPWLDLLGVNVYGIARNPSVATQGTVVLSDAASAGPFTITAGQLYVANAAGLRWQNVAGGVLPKNGTLSLTFAAEQPGAAYNVGNATVTVLATPLPGVTVNNPDPGSGTWITQTGVDTETDAAYVSRCAARWASLGTGATASTYDLWARTAAPAITRTVVIQDPGANTNGQVLVYCAGSGGASGGADVTAANSYIQARKPLANSVIVSAASNLSVLVTAQVNYFAAKTTLAALQAACAANLNTLFQNAPMGIDAAGTNRVYVSAIIEQLQLATGVRNVTVIAPAVDVILTTGQVATLTQSLTFVAF